MTRAPHLVLLLSLLLAQLCLPDAAVADDEDYTRSGFYLEGTLTPAMQFFEDDFEDMVSDEAGESVRYSFQPGFGPKLITACRIIPHLGVQAQVSWRAGASEATPL